MAIGEKKFLISDNQTSVIFSCIHSETSSYEDCFILLTYWFVDVLIYLLIYFTAPDAPPEDFQVFNSSSTSLRIEFDPVHPDLINGILRGYRVFYWKTREGNLTRKNFTITKEPGSNSVIHRRQKRSAGLYHEGYPLFADIYNLEEYTNYTVQIQAITILDGVLAPPFTTLTAEDRK